MVLLPWWVTLQATLSVSSAHALPVTVVVLMWHLTLQARPSVTSLHALPALLGALLLWWARLQAMTNATLVHTLPMRVVVMLCRATMQATSYVNSFAALPVELRWRPTVYLALRSTVRSMPLL
jgi:hypothetical protein